MIIRLGRILGISIELAPGWFILLGLFIYLMSIGCFDDIWPWLYQSTEWAFSTALSLIFLVTLSIHELVRGLIARFLGNSVNRTTPFTFDGTSPSDIEHEKPVKDIIRALSAPALSLLSAVLLWLAAGSLEFRSTGQVIVSWSMVSFVFIAVFDLLPFVPFDGGCVLRAVIRTTTRDPERAGSITARFGQAFGWLLVISGVAVAFTVGFMDGFWLAVVGWFISSMASQALSYQVYRHALNETAVEHVITHRVETIDPSTTLDRLINDHYSKSYSIAYPVADDKGLVRSVSLESVQAVPKKDWPSTAVESVARNIDSRSVAYTGEDAWNALKRMNMEGLTYLYVLKGHEVVGLVNRSDISRMLNAREDLDTLVVA